MKVFLSVTGPIVANFMVWAGITALPLHPLILLASVILSGVLMLYGMAYFRGKADEVRSLPGHQG